MIKILRLLLLSATIFLVQCSLNEEELKEYLATTFEKEDNAYCKNSAEAAFAFAVDIKNATKQKLSEESDVKRATWAKETWEKYFKDLKPADYQDPSIKRMAKQLVVLGTAILDTEKIKMLTNLVNELQSIYSTAKVCPYKKQSCDLKEEGLNLQPEITDIFDKSRDYDELTYVWKAWRDASGAKMRGLYKTYVELVNEGARLNNFSDAGAYWRHGYEDDQFVEHVDEIWDQVEPLYTELLTYVGRKLKEFYGDQMDIEDGLYPAHVFGNNWAQTWSAIEDITIPYPNASKFGSVVDEELKKKGYSVLDIMKISDKFYTSLGLPSNAVSFDESKGALIVKPTDGREVVCHASAWDFCDGETFRLKMCTKVNLDDLITIHHEMGHINYYLLYKNQPSTFRTGANPGFHEAVGDSMALSVASLKHFQKIGLLDVPMSRESTMNVLYSTALEKVAFLPFGILIDKWRWDVFNGSVGEDEWNKHWWALRMKYQKMKPPVTRSENDFDPGAKFHVPGDSQYIAYFVARILQFQFFKSACIAAGQYNPDDKTVPLHECDFDGSLAAGQIFKDGLSLGSSRHWSEVLKIMTGEDKLNAQPMLEYFEPLYQYLKEENARNA